MTYEEIKEKYPIGSVLHSIVTKVHHTNIYYTEEDIEIYKKNYLVVEIYPNNICECYRNGLYEILVEAWLFDGKCWKVAYEDSEGYWRTYDDDELKRFEIEKLKKRI